MAKTGGRRTRRVFSEEFRAGAVRLVLDEGKSASAVARDLTESALRVWVARAHADRTKGKSGGLTTAEREELARLRRENRQLRLERDIPKEAAAFFAGRLREGAGDLGSAVQPYRGAGQAIDRRRDWGYDRAALQPLQPLDRRCR